MHRRLLTLARQARLALFLTIISGLLSGWLIIGQAWLVSGTVNAVFIEDQSLAHVWGWLVLVLIIIAARASLTWIHEVSAGSLAVQVKTRLRQLFFNHILKLGPSFSRVQRTGELCNAAVESIESLDGYYSQYLPQLALAALVPISILIFAFPVDLLSALIMLVTAPLIPFFMVMIGRGAQAVTRKQYDSLGQLSAHFLDSLQGLTTLKLFGQSKLHACNIARVNARYRDATLGVLRITFLSALALELLATLSTAIIAVEIGLRLLYARLEFREAFFLLILAPEFYQPLRMLGARFHASLAGNSAGRRIFEILDTPVSGNQGTRDHTAASGAPEMVAYENVCFTYPDENTPVLTDITLKIHRGQSIALVGRTGAGKSTLVSALLGFVRPSGGQILVDGKPLTSVDPDDWRMQVAWVPQKPYLFHDTLAANICLARPDAAEHEWIESARAAHLHDWIESLPAKYETVIGEGGARLSAGQAQRLALARAFLKNAPILILDESTSNLDPETEALLEESTRRLMQGRTVISIAHRMNTVFQADRIIVVDQGRIVEQGTHTELISQNGVYALMVKAHDHRESIQLTNARPDLRQPVPARGSNFDTKPGSFPPRINDLKSQIVNCEIPAGGKSAIVDREVPEGGEVPVGGKSRVFFRLLSFLQGSWRYVALSVLLSTLTIGSSVALMGTSAWLISMAALHPSIAELGISIVGVRLFGISRGVFRYSERLVSHNVTFRLLARLRVWFYEKLEPLAPARLMEYRAGDILARILSDVNTLENFYVRVVAPPLTATLIGAGVSVFFAAYDYQLALASLGFFLTLGLFLPLFIQYLSRRAGTALAGIRGNLNSQLVDGIQGLADILAYGRAQARARQLGTTSEMFGRLQMQMARLSGLHSALITLLTNLGLWVILYIAIPKVNAGGIDGLMLGALALILLASFEAVMPLPQAAQMWESASASAQRLFEIVDAEPLVRDPPARMARSPAVSATSLVSSHPLSITIEDLSFTYPGNRLPALQNITFDLQPGRCVAIVGPSGAGKSTLANLLVRFWEYSLGEIHLNGESLKNQGQAEVHRSIGLLGQNEYFFNTTLRENLRLANPAASTEEIQNATRRAQINEFIDSLPKGLDTIIGEQGVRLSGGERQRLAIARLLLKESPILILDEPTANLDPLTERQVLDTLFEVLRGRTTLWITHRLVNLESVDQILVMDRGRILERGVHAQLLAQGGFYKHLFDLQNRILTETAK